MRIQLSHYIYDRPCHFVRSSLSFTEHAKSIIFCNVSAILRYDEVWQAGIVIHIHIHNVVIVFQK